MRVRGSLGELAVASLLGTLAPFLSAERRSRQAESFRLFSSGERRIARTAVT